MKPLCRTFLFLISTIFFPLFAQGLSAKKMEKPKVCMVLDKGGKDDHSFNASAVAGFKKALKQNLISSKSFFVEPKNDAQISQYLSSFVGLAKCDFIISVGFNPSSYVPPIAQRNSGKKFLAIDTDISAQDKNKNILSITFEEQEGSFLVGAIAAMKSQTEHVGFVGGMDVPIIHRFLMGYEAGAKYINPNIKFDSVFLGVTPTAWNNPARAKEVALAQYENKVDVIFQVAASSGAGVFGAAEEMNKKEKDKNFVKRYAIGVDANQNWIKPGIILTSMVKKVDEAVFQSISQFREGKLQSGVISYGLKNNGVDWAYDKYNKSLFTTKDLNKIDKIKQKIIALKIKVPDFYKKQSDSRNGSK